MIKWVHGSEISFFFFVGFFEIYLKFLKRTSRNISQFVRRGNPTLVNVLLLPMQYLSRTPPMKKRNQKGNHLGRWAQSINQGSYHTNKVKRPHAQWKYQTTRTCDIKHHKNQVSCFSFLLFVSFFQSWSDEQINPFPIQTEKKKNSLKNKLVFKLRTKKKDIIITINQNPWTHAGIERNNISRPGTKGYPTYIPQLNFFCYCFIYCFPSFFLFFSFIWLY